MIHFDLFTRCIFTFTKSKNSRQQTKKEKVPMSNNNASEKTNYAVFDRRLLGLFPEALKLVTSFLETPVSSLQKRLDRSRTRYKDAENEARACFENRCPIYENAQNVLGRMKNSLLKFDNTFCEWAMYMLEYEVVSDRAYDARRMYKKLKEELKPAQPSINKKNNANHEFFFLMLSVLKKHCLFCNLHLLNFHCCVAQKHTSHS